MTIKINNTDIVLRPSSIDNAQQCAYQWAKVFLEGIITIPNSRAAIGTGIHSAVEHMWSESIAKGEKEIHMDSMTDAAIESFNEEAKKGMRYDEGENVDSCHKEIINGTTAFVDDLVPFLDIPDAVEQRYTINLDHPVVSAISGTVDYIGGGNLDDVKTSKRKPSVANYTTQQSIYKMLAQAEGKTVDRSRIQGVVLTKAPYGIMLELEPNIDQAKYLVNNLLDKIEVLAADVAPAETIFSCNTKYYLCSPKYCSLHGSCPATKRAANAVEKVKL